MVCFFLILHCDRVGSHFVEQFKSEKNTRTRKFGGHATRVPSLAGEFYLFLFNWILLIAVVWHFVTSTLKAQELRGGIGQDSYLAIEKLARGILDLEKTNKQPTNGLLKKVSLSKAKLLL